MAEVDVGLPVTAAKTVQIQFVGLEGNATDTRVTLVGDQQSYRLGRVSGGYGFVVYEIELTPNAATFKTRGGPSITVPVGEAMFLNCWVYQQKSSPDPAAFRVSVVETPSTKLTDLAFVEGSVKKTDKKADEMTRTTGGVVEWIVGFPLKFV